MAACLVCEKGGACADGVLQHGDIAHVLGTGSTCVIATLMKRVAAWVVSPAWRTGVVLQHGGLVYV